MARRTILTLADDEGVEQRLDVVGLDRLAFDRLLAEHPPRLAEKSLWNDVTFPPALISACTGLPPTAAARYWTDGPVDETDDVLEACVELSAPGSWVWAKQRLLRDPRLRMEMRVCTRAGIPHSHFLGGPLVWTDDDQDLALAAYELEQDRCPGCGIHTEAMKDPDAARIEQFECFWCEQLDAAREAVPTEAKNRVHSFVAPVTAEA